MTTHLLLIDDHALFRVGIGMMLETALENLNISHAASIEQALKLPSTAFDLVLLDVQLQGMNGLDGLNALKQKWPDTKVIVLSGMQDAKLCSLAIEQGADRFISKAETPERMLELISQLLVHLTPAVQAAPANKPLTPRQCEVLELLSQGLSNKMIGRRLHLSENTVRGHVQATFAALNVSSRSEAAFVARRQGLVR